MAACSVLSATVGCCCLPQSAAQRAWLPIAFKGSPGKTPQWHSQVRNCNGLHVNPAGPFFSAVNVCLSKVEVGVHAADVLAHNAECAGRSRTAAQACILSSSGTAVLHCPERSITHPFLAALLHHFAAVPANCITPLSLMFLQLQLPLLLGVRLLSCACAAGDTNSSKTHMNSRKQLLMSC